MELRAHRIFDGFALTTKGNNVFDEQKKAVQQLTDAVRAYGAIARDGSAPSERVRR